MVNYCAIQTHMYAMDCLLLAELCCNSKGTNNGRERETSKCYKDRFIEKPLTLSHPEKKVVMGRRLRVQKEKLDISCGQIAVYSKVGQLEEWHL